MAVVKNTFIDVPSSPRGAGMPSPLASAPAQVAFSLKESLAQAAGCEADDKRKRARPSPLTMGSMTMPPPPMITPSASTALATSMPSIPPTPVAGWELPTPTRTPAAVSAWELPTPTRTPAAAYTYSAPFPVQSASLQPVAQPIIQPVTHVTYQPRATLSLVDMIQSPKPEMKAAMLHNAYQHVYQQNPGGAPTSGGVSAATAPSSNAFPGTVGGAAAAVQLGLVPQPVMSGPVNGVAVGSAPPQYAAPSVPPPPTNPAPTTVVTMAQVMGPSIAPPSAPPSIPPSIPAVASTRFMVPPPPSAPAPTFLLSPTGGKSLPPLPLTSPKAVPKTPKGANSPESDAQVLLALAKASGNQAAVDAAMRQARQSGLIVE